MLLGGASRLSSDHLPILLFVTLFPVFRPNQRSPSFNFQKVRWDGFASYIDSYCPSAEEYSSLSLSSAAALFTSLALNGPNLPFLSAASNAILKPGGPLRWKVRLVKDARLLLPLTEVMKIARLSSPLLDAPRQSSPRLRHGRRLAVLLPLNQTPKLYTLFFALSLAHLPRLPPLQTSPTVLLPGNRHRSMSLTCDPTFPFLSQRPCAAEPEATSLSSAEPRALRSLTSPSALLSPLVNFLRLPPTFSRPLPLAQTKLPTVNFGYKRSAGTSFISLLKPNSLITDLLVYVENHLGPFAWSLISENPLYLNLLYPKLTVSYN